MYLHARNNQMSTSTRTGTSLTCKLPAISAAPSTTQHAQMSTNERVRLPFYRNRAHRTQTRASIITLSDPHARPASGTYKPPTYTQNSNKNTRTHTQKYDARAWGVNTASATK